MPQTNGGSVAKRAANQAISAIQLPFKSVAQPPTILPLEKHGVVYTKKWVVDLILDLAGYTADRDLANSLAVEPAAGEGAFLIPMIERLLESCQRHSHSVTDTESSILAYELDEAAADKARSQAQRLLRELGVPEVDINRLIYSWIRVGDYLLDAPILPRADFVIGNPPYIRLEDMDDGIAADYRRMYRTMTGRADIYIAFFEAALRQLSPNGVCAYICADRWMRNQYGAELRRFITASYQVETVIEMHTAEAFLADVSAYPAVTIIRRASQASVVVARSTRDAEHAGASNLANWLQHIRVEPSNGLTLKGMSATRVDNWFRSTDPWPIVSPERLAILKYLEDHFLPLESVETETKVGIGVATGADDVFITTNPDLVESARLLPLAMASDIEHGQLHWSGHYLVDPWNIEGLVDLDRFPRMKIYLERYKVQLRTRHVGQRSGDRWYRTIDRVNHHLVSKPKLYLPDIKGQIEPVLDTGQTYPHHNLYVVQSERWDHEVLGGLLLSAIGQFFVECYAVRMRGGYFRFQAQYLRRIRVPRPEDISIEMAEQLRDAFRQRNRALATQLALKLYGLTTLPPEDDIGA
jgi:hypothetical protein